MDNIEVVENHFKNLLYPRNHGLIGVTDLRPVSRLSSVEKPPRPSSAPGFLVTLGHDPFMEVLIAIDAISLYVGYPLCFMKRKNRGDDYEEDWNGTVHTLPTRPQDRYNVLRVLGEYRVPVVLSHTRFDLEDPESISRAEFVVQTTITRVRGLVCQKGGRLKMRDDAYFNDLIGLATQDFLRKNRQTQTRG